MKSRIAIGSISVVVGLTVLGKLGAFSKEVLFSLLFGATSSTDAYFIAAAVPGLIFAGVLATITSVFLPIYSRELGSKNGKPMDAIDTGIVLYVALAAGIGVATAIFADKIVVLVAPKASSDVLELATFLTQIFAFGFAFSGWVGLQNAILQSHKRFIWPLIVPVFNHFVVISGLIVAYVTGNGMVLVAIFAVGGWVSISPLIGFQNKGRFKESFGRRFSLPIAKKIVLLSFPVFLGITVDQLNSIVDIYLGSGLGHGAVSHLTYASRLMLFIASVFSLLVSYLIFPYLADSFSTDDHARSRRLVNQGLALVIILTVPLIVISFYRSEALISLVFRRGQFSAQDAVVTAQVLQYYVVGMLFIGVREVLNRVFLARQQVKFLLVFGLISAVVNVLSSLFFMKYLGLAGIALGTSCGAVAYVLLQAITIYSKTRWIMSKGPVAFFSLSIIGSFVMVMTFKQLAALDLFPSGNWGFIIEALLATICYFAIAGTSAYWVYRRKVFE